MSAPATPPAPPPRPGPLQPGWTTSEFWSMLLVHTISVVTIVLTFATGSAEGLRGAEAVVPAAALLMSAAAHVVYVRGRVHLKLGHLGRVAGQIEADVRAVEPLARQLAPLVMAEDPELAQRIAAAVAAGGQHAEPAASQPRSPEAAAPAR